METSSESTHKCSVPVRRASCFGTCSGMNFILIAFLSFLLFLTATGLIAYYMSEYHHGSFKWRDYNTTESKEQSMNTHALLTVFGFITLGGIGITMYTVSTCCEHASLRVLHVFIQLAAAAAIVAGLYIPYEINKNYGRSHFYTTHSCTGWIAVGLFALVMGCGILKFILLLMCGPVSCCLRASCIPIHAGLGLAAYWAAIAAIANAIQRDLVEATLKRKKYKGVELGLWWGDTLSDNYDITRNYEEDEDRQFYEEDKFPKIRPRYRRPIFVFPERQRKKIPSPRFTILPAYVPEWMGDPSRKNSFFPTDPTPEDRGVRTTSPIHTNRGARGEGDTPILDRVHLAGGFTFLLICCGLLVTYSVLSRFWARR